MIAIYDSKIETGNKLLVEKYNGTITTFTNNDVFHLNILFNLDEKLTK